MKLLHSCWDKCKRYPFQVLFTLLLIVQLSGIIYANLFQNQNHLGYDASVFFIKAIEMWKQKTPFPLFVEQNALFLDSSLPLAALLYGITKNVFVAYGIANIVVSIGLFAVLRSLLKRFHNATYLSVVLPLTVLFSPFIVSFQNGNPINDLYSILHVSGAFLAGRMLIGFLCVKGFLSLYSRGESGAKPGWGLPALCVLLCFVSGLSTGYATIATFLLPLLIAWIVKAGLSSFDSKPLPNASALVFTLVASASCLLGRYCSSALLGFTPSDSRNLVGAFDFLKNLGSIYVGFLQLLGALPTFTEVALFSMRGIAFLCNFVIAHILLFVFIYAVKKCKWACKPIDTLIYICIIAFNCFYFAVCWLTYGGPIFELRYLTHVFICMVCLLGYATALFDAKVQAKFLRFLVLGGAFALLLYSNAIAMYTYHNTTISSVTDPVLSTIEKYDSKLVYGTDRIVTRNLRALDTDRVYKTFAGSGDTSLDRSGDYLYYEDAGEYRGKTLLLSNADAYGELPVYVQARFAFSESVHGTEYNIYVSESPVIDRKKELPEAGVAINFPYTPGVALQHGDYGPDGYFRSDGTGDYILLGPHAPVSLGTYRFTLHYEAAQGSEGAIGWFSVTTGSGQNTIATTEMQAADTSATIESVTFPNMGEAFEHRVRAADGAEIKIYSIEIEKISGE